MYLILISTHATLALLSISGFLLRGYWMMTGSALLQHRATKITPHIIDTFFLASGIALVFGMHLNVLQNAWLLAKLIGLVLYILLGMVVMRFGRTQQVRMIAFAGAVAVYAYIVGAALSKSPFSWLAYLG